MHMAVQHSVLRSATAVRSGTAVRLKRHVLVSPVIMTKSRPTQRSAQHSIVRSATAVRLTRSALFSPVPMARSRSTQMVCAAFGFEVSNCCAAEATCTDFTRAVRIDSVAVSVDSVVVSKSRSDSLLALCCMAI